MNPYIQVVAAFFGSLGFALLFNLRGRWLFFTALGGGLSWCIYLISGSFISHYERISWCIYLISGSFISHYERQYFAAAFFLGIYSELMARKTKSPSTLYLVVGMIPLIPGAALYYMMRNAIQTNFKMFAERGLEAIITGGAIASGIITAMVCWNVIKLNLLKK